MRKFLFVLASTGSLATMNAAIAQYPAPGYTPLATRPLATRPLATCGGSNGSMKSGAPTPSCVRTTKTKERQITRSGADPLA